MMGSGSSVSLIGFDPDFDSDFDIDYEGEGGGKGWNIRAVVDLNRCQWSDSGTVVVVVIVVVSGLLGIRKKETIRISLATVR